MAVISVPYHFRQAFRVPARAAYVWCTDFGPDDGAILADGTVRSVRRINEHALVLTDTTYPGGRRRRIRRLVRLDPSELAWTNTHLDGPFQGSQYWYRVAPDGSQRSHLEFTGLRLETARGGASAARIAARSATCRRVDAGVWRRRLAPALERDAK
jgi:hypothetical protein